MTQFNTAASVEMTRQMLLIARAHLEPKPHNQVKVYELLAALAVVAGAVISSCDGDAKEVLAWFELQVADSVEFEGDDGDGHHQS